MKNTLVTILLVGFLSPAAWAVNADSLGGVPWQSYLRGDVEDTAAGPLYLDQVNWLYGYAPPGKLMMQWDNSGNGIVGYNRSNNAPLIYGINESVSQPWMELRADSACPSLISLHGMSTDERTNDLLYIDQVSGNASGIGIYATKGTGIYVDHAGTSTGIRIENNEWSTGCGLWIDNCLTGTALEISDINTGRIIRTSQDLGDKPAITMVYRASVTGGPDDSSMYYWWGMKGHKAEVETVKTALCGLRSFGNGGINLCDTILVSGVAESTIVVTANYAGGFESATCTPLRVKVESGVIIIKRGATTDPDRYYWQGTMMLSPGQKTDPEPPVPGDDGLGFRVYPNPSSGLATIRYALLRSDRVQITIYNMLGQKVKTLVDNWQPAGSYSLQWDGRNEQGKKAAAGIYLCRVNIAGREDTQKMVVVK